MLDSQQCSMQCNVILILVFPKKEENLDFSLLLQMQVLVYIEMHCFYPGAQQRSSLKAGGKNSAPDSFQEVPSTATETWCSPSPSFLFMYFLFFLKQLEKQRRSSIRQIFIHPTGQIWTEGGSTELLNLINSAKCKAQSSSGLQRTQRSKEAKNIYTIES